MRPDPGLHVFSSNLVERLGAQLALDIAVLRGDAHAWTPATIIVPNPNVRDYLKRGLADAFGVAANLRFHFLERFWRACLGGNSGLKLLDRASLRGVLLSLLQDEAVLEAPELGPIRSYLDGSPRDLKRVQLAERLAGLYERYLLHRPDWLLAWERDQRVTGARPARLALWQARLWREIRTRLKGTGRFTLPEWVEGRSTIDGAFPQAVFVFGMSHMAPLYHRALARMAERTAVRLYLVNPCREPWDDGGGFSGFAGPPLEADDPFQLLAGEGSPLLHRWARPGREQLRLLGELTHGDLAGRFEPTDTPGALGSLQAWILDPATPRGPLQADGSLQVIPCPTPAREAEVAASLVWELVRKPGGGLHFDDICVLVPPGEQAHYLLHLREAFAGAEGIPWSQAMGASRRLEGMVEAAGVLMQLATGELTRAEILRAASHPVLAGRWQGLDPDAWPGLCERAGIVARLDAAETAGTYLEGGTWTWDQGLTRMALGCFMREEATPGFFPVSGTEAPGLVASLGALTADLRYLAQGRLPVGAWLDRLERVLQTYLLPAPERAEEGEAEAFARLVKALEGLRSLETAPLPPPVLDFQAFRALAAGALASARADHALPLGRGVQVGCYTPLRAIPYKVMILLGLGEGLFPAADRPDPMDLLAESPRRAGDVGASERDRYLFLEAVLSARQNLVVTYPSQDVLTGEALQPSPLLLDLAEVLGPEAWSTVRLPEQPRHRHDPAAFPHLAPQGTAIPCHHREAREEAELRHLGQALRAQAGGRDLPWRLLRQGPGPLVRALGPRLSLATPLAPEPPALPGRIRVTLAQLKRWLECPVQGGEAIRLGIRSIDDEDPAELVQEPLDTGALERHGLLREAFWRHVAAQEPLEDAYRMVRAAREARAQVPRGPMAEGEQASHLAQLETWRQQLPEGPGCVLHRFGSAPVDGALPVEDHPPLDLELTLGGKAHTVRLEGLSAPEQDGTFLLLTTRAIASLAKEPAPSDRDQRQMLAAWLAHLALCAQGEVQERKARLQSAAPKKAAVVETAFPCLSQEEARAQLETWLEEIFAEPPPRRLMPIEALLAKTPVKDLREFVDGKDDGDDVPELACFRGPVPRAKDLETEPDLSEGERRLQGFLAIAFSWRSL